MWHRHQLFFFLGGALGPEPIVNISPTGVLMHMRAFVRQTKQATTGVYQMELISDTTVGRFD